MTTRDPSTPTTKFVNVTPKLAAEWLASNTGNRNLRPKQVNKWARDMTSGRWTYSNDGICFAVDGTLINGQHRLTAVIESGQTVPMLIVRNMPFEARLSMDNPAVRKASDALGYAGEKNTTLLAAITRLVILIDDGRMFRDNKVQGVSHTEIVAFVEDNPILRHIAEVIVRVRTHIDCPPSALGAAFWVIQESAGTVLTEFYFDQLATRQNEPSGSAILAVDSRLRQIRRGNETHVQRKFIRLLVKGWNAYAINKPVETLSMEWRGEFKIPPVARWTRTDITATDTNDGLAAAS